MKTINLTIITLLLLIFSCTSKTPKKGQLTDSSENVSLVDSVEDKAPKASLLNADILEKQTFKINGKKKVTLTSKGGVKLTIAKNTFVDSKGNAIKGDIEIEYKEALNPTDIVLGNMTTTYNGKFLESGGMVYINATANGEQLSIANNKSIDFDVPAKTRKKGMMLFEGKEESGKINWIEPKKIEEPKRKAKAQKAQLKKVEPTKSFWNYYYHTTVPNTTTYIAYRLNDTIGVGVSQDLSATKLNKINSSMYKIANTNNNIPDTIYKIEEVKVQLKVFPSKEEFEKLSRFRPLVKRNFSSNTMQGINTFAEDKNASYVFKVKKLGWANIDRLFSDPRTKDVEFITKIDTHKDFDKLYISILFPKQNMYIPGYQKKDNTFSFTHGDYEAPKFPVGETAIVLATGYKNDVPYFAMKKLVIANKQTVSLQLQETTKEGLKTKLKAEI